MQKSEASFRAMPMQGMHETEAKEEVKCVSCGSPNTVPGGRAGRRKCLQCNFNFDEELAKKADIAGAITPASEETLASADEPDTIHHTSDGGSVEFVSQSSTIANSKHIPRTPTYVFISKTRTRVAFATKRTVKQVALEWESLGKYDIYELVPKTSSVKVDIA